MLNAALRALRPVVVRSARKSTSSTAFRALSTTTPRFSGPAPPSLFGEGAKPGEIPSDEQQATGLERFQLLGEMQGVDAFDLEPLDSSRVGTLEDPIKVFSLDTSRIVGCTGSPAESHELHWFTVKKEKNRRCPECGSVYALDFQGVEHHDAHHH
jgi:cytochrome c oxidase subunit 5b